MIEFPLHTERLMIRRFGPHDLSDYMRFMLDSESTRFLALEPEQTTEVGAKALFDYVSQSYDTPEIVHAYAIVENKSNSYVGSCGFAPYSEGVVECYYSINPEFRQKGFAVEATKALLDALSPFVEVRAYCHPENFAAHAVARKSGMQPLGNAKHETSGLEGKLFVLQRKLSS